MSAELVGFIRAQIERHRAFERKVALYCTFGPVPLRGKMPTAGERAAAAAASGDHAAERMQWEAALQLAEREPS